MPIPSNEIDDLLYEGQMRSATATQTMYERINAAHLPFYLDKQKIESSMQEWRESQQYWKNVRKELGTLEKAKLARRRWQSKLTLWDLEN